MSSRQYNSSNVSGLALPPSGQKKSSSQTQCKVGSTIKVDPRRLASPPVGPGFHVNIQVSSPKLVDKKTKLLKFKEEVRNIERSGEAFRINLQNIHSCLLNKELHQLCLNDKPAVSPIELHDITSEYRTKMTDWMVEVCTSFKCSKRTYFLAVCIFDKYLTKQSSLGRLLTNKDVHCIGVTSMYLASKYEDIYPLHSKIVSEKIAHKAISAKEILRKEVEFLELFDFQVDLVTHWDIYETVVDKLKLKLNEAAFKPLKEMALILVKMAM